MVKTRGWDLKKEKKKVQSSRKVCRKNEENSEGSGTRKSIGGNEEVCR